METFGGGGFLREKESLPISPQPALPLLKQHSCRQEGEGGTGGRQPRMGVQKRALC